MRFMSRACLRWFIVVFTLGSRAFVDLPGIIFASSGRRMLLISQAAEREYRSLIPERPLGGAHDKGERCLISDRPRSG